MTLKFNNNQINNLLFNGKQLNTLKLNGVIVWTKNSDQEIEYVKGHKVFESSANGNYKVDIKYDGTYNIICIGAGGGGSSWLYRWGIQPSSWRSASASGGAGGVFRGEMFLTAGSYNITIGKGGEGKVSAISNNNVSRPSYPNIAIGEKGGDSYISNIVTSYGGTGGSSNLGEAIAGIGGFGESVKGNDGLSHFLNSGTIRTTENGGNYIETWNDGGLNGTKYGFGGGCNSSYFSKTNETISFANSGGNGFVSIIKA